MLWGLITLNGLVFRHAHRLADGWIIVHTHPYRPTGKPGPIPYKPHSKAELIWLDVCDHTPVIGTEPLTVVFETLTVLLPRPVFIDVVSLAIQSARFPFLRGPPVRVGSLLF